MRILPIEAFRIFSAFRRSGVSFFTGVPDSALGAFCSYVAQESKLGNCQHVTAANEGNAIGIAAGSYLASGKVPLVYMQNSGLGNAINPLTSLVHANVYSIPMIIMVGHRGKPGQSDEPQHIPMGSITEKLVTLMGFDSIEVSNLTQNPEQLVAHAVASAKEKMQPYFLIVDKSFISSESNPLELKSENKSLGYYEVVDQLISQLDCSDVVFSTTGYISRVTEDIILRSTNRPLHFMNVGSMGHLSSIAFGYAMNRQSVPRNTLIIDGDGSSLMHLGGLLNLEQSRVALRNVSLCILNNSSHLSVGGQPTSAPKFRFITLFPNEDSQRIENKRELKSLIRSELFKNHLTFFEVIVDKGIDRIPPRPTRSPMEIRHSFLDSLTSAL